MKKGILLLVFFLSVFLSLQVIAYAEFTDIRSDNTVLTEAIHSLNAKGIIKGINDTVFGVDEKVTREQMAAFLYRMVNDGKSLEGGENETTFTDLEDPTYYAMISWANKEGIVKGVSESKFNPKGNITLQDCYTMVVRALGYKEAFYPDGYIIKAGEKNLDKNKFNQI